MKNSGGPPSLLLPRPAYIHTRKQSILFCDGRPSFVLLRRPGSRESSFWEMIWSVGISTERVAEELVFVHGQLASYSLSRRPQSTTTPIRGEGFGYSAEEVFFAKRFKQPERCQETYWKVTAVPDILQGTRETRMQDTGREEGLERHECRIRTEML